MPFEETEKQRIANYLAARKAHQQPEDQELYKSIREQLHQQYPIHSLPRTALIHEAYGGALQKPYP